MPCFPTKPFLHVASSSEIVMATAMFQSSKGKLRGTAPQKLVCRRTKNWMERARGLGKGCSNCIRATVRCLARAIHCSDTEAHAALRFAFRRRRQAVMAFTLGDLAGTKPVDVGRAGAALQSRQLHSACLHVRVSLSSKPGLFHCGRDCDLRELILVECDFSHSAVGPPAIAFIRCYQDSGNQVTERLRNR
ncbi:hypothetical protein ACVJGD_001357 [Bradyrhizobium sp. USDA 10063]